MIRLSIQLAVASARSGPARVVLSVLGGGLAILLVAAAISIEPALQRQDFRQRLRVEPRAAPDAAETKDALLWAPALNPEPFGSGRPLLTIAVASTGPTAPRPLGARRAPGPREVLISPELRRQLDRGENQVYKLRVPGPIVGTLGKEILASPDDLVMMVGWDDAALRDARPVAMTELRSVPTRAVDRPQQSGDLRGRILNIVLGMALLLPLMVFVRIAGRLADTRRRARLAALELVGATPSQLRIIAGVEVALLSIAALAVAAATAVLFGRFVPEIRVAGSAFFVDDLRPPTWQLSLLSGLLPVLSYGAVGKSTTMTSVATVRAINAVRHPVLRLVPLIAGWVALLTVATTARSGSDGSTILIGAGLAAVLIGLVLMVPIAVEAVTALVSRATRGAVGLLASGALRLFAASRSRALSGVATALLTGSLAAVYFPSHDAWQRSSDRRVESTAAIPDALVTINGSVADASLARDISAIEGIHAVLPIVRVEDGGTRSFAAAAVGECTALQRLIDGVTCRSGPSAAYAARPDVQTSPPHLVLSGGAMFEGEIAAVEPRLAHLFPPVDYLLPASMVRGTLSADRLLIDTDGTKHAAERLRGYLAGSRGPSYHVLAATDTTSDGPSRNQRDYAKAQLVAAFLALVATASVAVAQGASILERQRQLGLLVATGVPVGTLRRAAFLEAAAPLSGLAVLATAFGGGIAYTLLRTVDIPVHLAWGDIAFMIGSVIGPVLLTLLLLLPLVRSAVAPTALRAE